WGSVAGDLLRADEESIRIARQLRDAGVEWIHELPPGSERATRAVQVALEVARLIAPPIRVAAQARLAARGEAAQRRPLVASEPEPPLSDSVARLLALLVSGSA